MESPLFFGQADGKIVRMPCMRWKARGGARPLSATMSNAATARQARKRTRSGRTRLVSRHAWPIYNISGIWILQRRLSTGQPRCSAQACKVASGSTATG